MLVISLHPLPSVTVMVEVAQVDVFSIKITVVVSSTKAEITGAAFPTVTSVEAVSAYTITTNNKSPKKRTATPNKQFFDFKKLIIIAQIKIDDKFIIPQKTFSKRKTVDNSDA